MLDKKTISPCRHGGSRQSQSLGVLRVWHSCVVVNVVQETVPGGPLPFPHCVNSRTIDVPPQILTQVLQSH